MGDRPTLLMPSDPSPDPTSAVSCDAVDSGHAQLAQLLQHRNTHPADRTHIDAQIRQTFGRTCAILVLDLAGFSRLTLRYGIIHFLGILQQLRAIAHPVITAQGGTLIKQDADNLFVIFDQAKAATEGAIALLKALQHANKTLPGSRDMEAGIGIGYGELLIIDNADLFGSEMNLASKLGEDLARPGEILLTQNAYTELQMADPALASNLEELTLSISGLSLTTYQLLVRQGRVVMQSDADAVSDD